MSVDVYHLIIKKRVCLTVSFDINIKKPTNPLILIGDVLYKYDS